MQTWITACRTADFAERSVLRFDTGGKTFAVYRSDEGEYFATDGHCTHERAHLADGLVIGDEIECPLHFGAFNFRTGEAVLAPACVDLKTFPVRVQGDEVQIDVHA